MKLLITAPLLLLTACASIDPPPPEMYSDARDCYQKVQQSIVSDNTVRLQAAKIQYKNELAPILIAAVEALASQNRGDPFSGCGAAIVAHIKESGATTRSVNTTVQKGVGVAGIIWTADIIAGGLAALASSGSSTITNSRVVSDSGNGMSGGGSISSSGDGLGTANVYGGNQAYGGIEPRGNQSGEYTTQPASNSGDNAPINAPDGGDVAVTLPEE